MIAEEELYFSLRRIFKSVFLVLAIFLFGTSGYYLIGIAEGKGWRLADCAYMTVITLSTVGFGEILDVGNSLYGRGFTVFLILCGMGVLLYGVSTITAFIVEGDLTKILARNKMKKQIQGKKGHYIVCGAGVTGSGVIRELLDTKRDFVVIESNIEKIEKARKEGEFLFIVGDASVDEVLLDANILEAAGLIACLPEDKDNLFVTMTARELNPDIRIISKVIDYSSGQKLLKAGANSIVSPSTIGSLRMVSELIRPSVVSFLDEMLRGREKNFRIEEFQIPEGSKLAGKSIISSGIYTEAGIPVLAVREKGKKEYIYNPPPDMKLSPGTLLIVLADSNVLSKLTKLSNE